MDAVKLGTTAINALMRGLSATIKPGLVDRTSHGAYKDRDFFMELRGINAVSPWLVDIAQNSIASGAVSPTILFTNVRKKGLKAEEDTIRVTGVNTHKGSLFCLGICLAAAGRAVSSQLWPDSNTVCVLASEMAADICQRELDSLEVKIKLIGEASLSPGEQAFMKYKKTGMRGEAQSGFMTVRKHALPLIKKMRSDKKVSLNDVYVQAYMTLMAHVDDTGISTSENDLAAEEIRDRANGILERGGVLTPIGREKIKKLDDHLRNRGLVPGGAGALLNTAIFLSMLDDEQIHTKKVKRKD